MSRSAADFRTRVVLLDASDVLLDIARKILTFNQVSFDEVSENSGENRGDFLLLATTDSVVAAAFRPTVVFVASSHAAEMLSVVSKAVTPGGIFIYPEKYSDSLPETAIFFRKLPYKSAETETANGEIVLNSSFGGILLKEMSHGEADDFEGLQLFCAQLGVTEEDFYNVLAEIF